MKLPVHVLPTVAVMTGTDFCDLGAGFTDSVLACLRRCHGKRVTLSSSMAAAAKVGVIVKFVRLIWQLVQKENCDVAGGSGGSGSDASGSGAIGSGASVVTALGSDSHSAVTALAAKMCELLHPRLTQEASAVGNSDAMRVVSRIYSCHLLLLLLPFYLDPAACCILDHCALAWLRLFYLLSPYLCIPLLVDRRCQYSGVNHQVAAPQATKVRHAHAHACTSHSVLAAVRRRCATHVGDTGRGQLCSDRSVTARARVRNGARIRRVAAVSAGAGRAGALTPVGRNTGVAPCDVASARVQHPHAVLASVVLAGCR